MKRPLLESEKNFLKCAFIMLVVGISLIALGKQSGGIICIAIAAVFAVVAIYMIVKENKK